jgi:hypothetical protein
MSAITDIFGAAGDSAGAAPQQYNTWQPQGTQQQDTNFNSAVNQNLNSGNMATPYWQNYLSQLTNNPYQTGAQNASNAAGGAYTNTGNAATANSAALSGGANTLLNTAMNPQSGLYNQLNQNNTDQTNASLAARGLNSSPVGAGIANQSNQTFNQNWQNNLQGLQSQALNTAGQGFNQAGNLGTSGAGSLALGGAQPLSTYNAGVSNLGSGLSGYNSGINSTNQNALSDIMQYLGLGASQSNAQGNFNNQYFQNSQSYANQQNDLNNQLWSSIGNLGGGLLSGGGLFSGGGNALPFSSQAAADSQFDSLMG